jgi:predicted NUDIX family phosphoesterase
MSEKILVVPRTDLPVVLPRKGLVLCAESVAQDLLRHRQFVERDNAEADPSLKQIIPYVVLRSHRLIFRYWRTKRAGESRLRHLYSIGLGGHINERDLNLYSSSEQDILAEATMRELREEVDLPSEIHAEFCGLLNDDETEVGSVHLGAVFVCNVDHLKVGIREKGTLGRGEWLTPQMLHDGVSYESWSEILINEWLKTAG